MPSTMTSSWEGASSMAPLSLGSAAESLWGTSHSHCISNFEPNLPLFKLTTT